MFSYFTTGWLATDPEDPTNYYNDANWSHARYDELYTAQNTELDPQTRLDQVHEMLRIFYDDAGYIPLYYSPDLQAYRNDRFEGWVRQPAEVGPVMFSNTSPSYLLLTPVGAGQATTTAATDPGDTTGDTTAGSTDPGGTTAGSTAPVTVAGSGSVTPWIIGGAAVVIVGVAVAAGRRRRSADERE